MISCKSLISVFMPQDIAVKGKSELTVTIREDTQKLDEVVVTALGMKRDKKSV